MGNDGEYDTIVGYFDIEGAIGRSRIMEDRNYFLQTIYLVHEY